MPGQQVAAQEDQRRRRRRPAPVPNASAASGETMRARQRAIARPLHQRVDVALEVHVEACSTRADQQRGADQGHDRAPVRRSAPGASQSPPRKVMITMPVMRGLASATMLARTRRALTRPGTASRTRRAARRSTCVASSAVATRQVRLDGGEIEEAGARRGCRARSATHDQHRRDDRQRAQIAARARRAAASRSTTRRPAARPRRAFRRCSAWISTVGCASRPERAAAERHVGAGEGGARVAHQAAQHHLEVDRHRRDQRQPRDGPAAARDAARHAGAGRERTAM